MGPKHSQGRQSPDPMGGFIEKFFIKKRGKIRGKWQSLGHSFKGLYIRYIRLCNCSVPKSTRENWTFLQKTKKRGAKIGKENQLWKSIKPKSLYKLPVIFHSRYIVCPKKNCMHPICNFFFLGRTQKIHHKYFSKADTFFSPSNRSTLWHCFSANGLS